MAACQVCGQPTQRFGSHCDTCYEQYQATVRAAAAAHPRTSAFVETMTPANSVVITDVQISFGRLVELSFLLTFAAIPAGLVFGVLWAIVRVLARASTP